MKKIFAKELAALAVLALAFTGCNTAFDGTNANFSEKESQYTDISGATASFSGANTLGGISSTGSIAKNNNKNVIAVTVTSFSKINIDSADKAIHFQQLTNNSTSGYYPIRGADLPKTRIKVDEGTGTGTFTTTITYEVNGTGVTTDKVALFVDAKELKTKGGSAVLALDANTKRGEESDSYIEYLSADGTTAITGTENFRPTYAPTGAFSGEDLRDASGKYTGVTRFAVVASNKKNTFQAGSADDYESGLKLNDVIVVQYRKPGNRTYEEKKLSWTYHEAVSSNMTTDPYAAHSYTADLNLDEIGIGTEYRVILTNPDGMTAPAWYKDVYGHPAIVYGAGSCVGAKISVGSGTYTLHKTVPSYIVVSPAAATAGTDATSTYNPTSLYTKAAIRLAQKDYFTVSNQDNWFQVSPATASVRDILDPATTKDFIVVDGNNKKIAADVEVITFSYNDSTATSGKVEYVKVTVKDVRYRNNVSSLKVCVGEGTKIKENKTYPNQKSFGLWKDVAEDDYAGYVALN